MRLRGRLNVLNRMYRYVVFTREEMGFQHSSLDGEDPFFLNNLGSQGYRLVAIDPGGRYIFERRTL